MTTAGLSGRRAYTNALSGRRLSLSRAYEDVLRTCGNAQAGKAAPFKADSLLVLNINTKRPRANSQPPSVARLRRRSHPPAASQLAHVGAVRYRPCTHARTLHTAQGRDPSASGGASRARLETDRRRVSMQRNTVRGFSLPRKQRAAEPWAVRAFPTAGTCGDGERCGIGVYIGRMTSST